MKAVRHTEFRLGLTATELLVAVVAIAAIMVVIIPLFISQPSKALPRSQRMQCANNLKQIGLSFRIYANEHAGLFPMQVAERDGGALESIERGDASASFR